MELARSTSAEESRPLPKETRNLAPPAGFHEQILRSRSIPGARDGIGAQSGDGPQAAARGQGPARPRDLAHWPDLLRLHRPAGAGPGRHRTRPASAARYGAGAV